MPPLIITQVASRGDLRSFIKLPWKLYKDDRYWIPPLLIELKSRLNLNRGLLRMDQAALFLARRGKEVVGRISASFLRGRLRVFGEGNFGYYEMIDDIDVAGALMDRAISWLKERKAKQVIGPYNFVLEDPCPGFLADSYDLPPCFMMAYSKPYYLDHMKALGFEKAMDLYTYEGRQDCPLPEKLLSRAQQAESIPNLRMRCLDTKNIYEEAEIIRAIFNEALKSNWGYAPLSRDRARNMARMAKFIGDEKIILIAEVDGKPVGVVINLPNYNEILGNCNGRLFPKGALRLLFKRRSIHSTRSYALAVLPEYQHSGLGSLLIRESFREGKKAGYERGEIGWVLESNVEMGALAQLVAGRTRKTYRVFKKDI